ncbi:MAG: DUF1893 domain-containing protein [Clostridiales bacterium]|nr:DUF1893 domain-containing protein [Clostridiales bacterium]
MNNSIIRRIKSRDIQFAVFDGKNLIEGKGIGVKPIVTPMRENQEYFKGKEVYDTIIGKAAAMLLAYSGATSVYGEVMSEHAVNMLKQNGIKYQYETLVPYIKNREHDGMCPLEEAVRNEDNLENAFDLIEKCIAELMNKH